MGVRVTTRTRVATETKVAAGSRMDTRMVSRIFLVMGRPSS